MRRACLVRLLLLGFPIALPCIGIDFSATGNLELADELKISLNRLIILLYLSRK